MRMENRRKGSEMKKTINVKLYNATAQKKGVNTVFLKKKLKMMKNALKIWKMKLYEKLDELESAQ